MKYWYMYAKCKNQNCSHINNWIFRFLNLHVCVTVPRCFIPKWSISPFLPFLLFFLSYDRRRILKSPTEINTRFLSKSWEIFQFSWQHLQSISEIVLLYGLWRKLKATHLIHCNFKSCIISEGNCHQKANPLWEKTGIKFQKLSQG